LRPIFKVGVVVLGYVAAIGIAWMATAIHQVSTRADAQGADGMYAAGDMFLFLAVFGVVAIVPTVFALYWLRSNRRFWAGLAALGVMVAATGIAAGFLFALGRHAVAPAPLALWASFSVLRILAAPIFTLGLLVSGFLSPYRLPRISLFAAAGIEGAVSAYGMLTWFGH